MRPRHTQHSLASFPVYSAVFTASDKLIVGGGGGSSRSGIKNKLRLYNIDSKRAIDLKSECEIDDAPTSMAVDTQSNSIICGINSSPEKILNGENENCRIFEIQDNAFHLNTSKGTLLGDEDDYQKVTVLSPNRKLLAVAGCHNISLLSFPSLAPVAPSIRLEKEIYDATFSGTSETLIVATTHNLFVYAIKSTPKKGRNKGRPSKRSLGEKQEPLELLHSVDLPSSVGGPSNCTFRSVRYHPSDDSVVYTIINTSPPRSRDRKTSSRQGYISKWNAHTWTIEKQRKLGDKGLTAFDISLDGRFLGYGSSDLSIGMLDSKTLSPLVTILKAHEFPPTVVKFDPTTTLFVSGSADNTIRIVTIPDVVGGSSWSVIILLLLALLIALIAFAVQSGSIGWQ